MTPTHVNERLFDRAYAKELIKVARADLNSARRLATLESDRIENVYLLAQQAVEKAIKAVLCSANQSIPFTHDIELLIDRIPKHLPIDFSRELTSLSEFAAIRRYLAGYERYSSEEVAAVLSEVEKVIIWGEAIIATHA